MQTGSRLLGDPETPIEFSQQNAAGIRGYLATLQVSEDHLGENNAGYKGE